MCVWEAWSRETLPLLGGLFLLLLWSSSYECKARVLRQRLCSPAGQGTQGGWHGRGLRFIQSLSWLFLCFFNCLSHMHMSLNHRGSFRFEEVHYPRSAVCFAFRDTCDTRLDQRASPLCMHEGKAEGEGQNICPEQLRHRWHSLRRGHSLAGAWECRLGPSKMEWI